MSTSVNIHIGYNSQDSLSTSSDNYSIERTNPPNISSYEYKYKKTLIFCPKCGKIPTFIFKSFKIIDINCECLFYENELIEKYYDFVFTFSTDKIKISTYTCVNHINRKFKYFCPDCNYDICKDCIVKDKKHITHSYTPLMICDKEFEKIREYKENEFFYKMMELIKSIYEEYPNSNLYETIKNAYNFICGKQNNNSDIIIQPKRMAKIRISRELIENKIATNEIIQIQIIRQNFYNINPLCKLTFPALKILNLSENNIDDISPLQNLNSPNLESLILLKNRINDKCIKCIKNFKFGKLNSLNFFSNYLTDYQIFDEATIFPNLQLLYIGENRFNENIDYIKLKEKRYNFSNLETLGTTRGVFSNETIKLISCFKFPKLKTLYLSGNNLNNLSFINHIDCPELEEIWLKDNDLENYDSLIKFEKLKIINLENNIIKSLENIRKFIEKGSLNKIYISNNKIDLNNKENKKLIEEFQSKIVFKLNYS